MPAYVNFARFSYAQRRIQSQHEWRTRQTLVASSKMLRMCQTEGKTKQAAACLGDDEKAHIVIAFDMQKESEEIMWRRRSRRRAHHYSVESARSGLRCPATQSVDCSACDHDHVPCVSCIYVLRHANEKKLKFAAEFLLAWHSVAHKRRTTNAEFVCKNNFTQCFVVPLPSCTIQRNCSRLRPCRSRRSRSNAAATTMKFVWEPWTI